jgi:hypothetical protein
MLDRSEALCPTTDKPCPALANIQNLYVGNADVVDHDTSTIDRIKFDARRRELVGAAIVRQCQGETGEHTCPTRDAMDVSPIRKSLVATARALLQRRTAS